MNAHTGTTAHPVSLAPSVFPARLLGWVISTACLLLLFAPGGSTPQAHAQLRQTSILLDPPQAQAGAIVLVNGEGFSPGGGVLTFFWNGAKIGTHPLDTGDTFSIPFRIPDDANPGDHRIDVCTGDPCDDTETARKASALLRITGALPHFGGSIAYIYNTDKSLVEAYGDLLKKVGFAFVPIALADVATTDFAPYRLVIIGRDTGAGREWGTEPQVAALQKAPRIVGIGSGGHAFFGKLGLLIGMPNGFTTTGDQARPADVQLTSARIPYDISTLVRNQRPLPLFQKAVGIIAFDLANQPTDLLPHAYLAGEDTKGYDGVIVGQGCRTLWGFHGAPDEMTALGRDVFINLIVFALGSPCEASLTAPCQQMTNQATGPAPALIDFDDMENGAEIGEYYANSHGVRFEQSTTNHAIIYGGHPNDPSQPRSAPNVASNSAIHPATSENVPLSISFDSDLSHVGMWFGNGENGQGNLANLNATLTAFDRQGKALCSARFYPVPISHTAFLGLSDSFGRIARVELDYGKSYNSESIDNLIFGPFAPANNIRICHQQETACIPAPNASITLLRGGAPISPPLSTDSQGYVTPRSRVAFGDALWATLVISESQRSSLLHTSGAPRLVLVEEFNGFPGREMTVPISRRTPLILYNLTVSTQWSLIGDTAYQNRLRSHIQKAANYLYDFTDGQMSLGKVHIFQNYDLWDEADVRIYASNNLRPHAEIGGVSEGPTPDPLVASLSYYPGHTFMGRTWNRFNLPGDPIDVGVDVSNDWPLALAHELGHYLLYLFDTYLAVTTDGEIIETHNCVGSAMGWVYEEPNTEFIFDNGHWTSLCGDTLAHHTLQRNEWETILLWYSSLVTPTVVNPGPAAPPASFATVTLHPPSNPAVVLPNQTFALAYQAGEGASAEARAVLFRGNRVIDQGKPDEDSTSITLSGAQTNDRFCVFDVNDYTDDGASPRHQFGCEVLAPGDNELQMKKDDNWAPIIEISHANSRTIGITVTQEISGGLAIRATLYPEDSDTTTEILLASNGNLHTGVFNSPVDAGSAYVQVFVDEAASEEAPRRETLVDYGVGGSGAQGPTSMFGGVPIVSSDGKAEYARETDIFLAEGEFIALQSMAGTPRPPAGRQVIGQPYRLVAFPRSLADEGHVALRIRPPRGPSRSAGGLPQVVVAYWNGALWRPLASVNLDDLIDGRVAIAPSKGVGVYALLLDDGTPPPQPIYLPQIERQIER